MSPDLNSEPPRKDRPAKAAPEVLTAAADVMSPLTLKMPLPKTTLYKEVEE